MAAIQEKSVGENYNILPPIGRGSQASISPIPQDTTVQSGAGFAEEFSYSSKLTNVEGQRIMAVIQELQRKVYLIGLLPDAMDRRVSTVFGNDTFNIIKDYRSLDQRYKTLVEAKDSNGKLNEISMNEAKEVSKLIKTATRTLCRHFIQNANSMSKLRYLKSTKSPIIGQFEHLLQEVKMLVYGRLKTTVEEEKAKQDQLSIIIAKEQKTSNEVKALKEELEKAKKERMGEINKRNEIIRRLKDELRDIKVQAEDATKKLEVKSKQKEELDIQNFKDKEYALLKEIDYLKAQLEEDTVKHREEEAILRKKKFKVESEVENWIHKYDQDMEEKQIEIDDITAIFMEEKGHLDELNERYTDLQKEYNNMLEEKRIAEEQKKQREIAIRKANEAATRIQALWKGFKLRKELKSKKNDKGKKEKGKGKKK